MLSLTRRLRVVRRHPGSPRRDPRAARRAGARGARPVRLREVDAAACGRRARAVGRRHHGLGRLRPGTGADPQARLRADVPGRPAVQPPDRGPQHRLRAAAAACRPASRPGSRSCWRWSASRATPTGCRPRCPEANGSAWRWPARLAVKPRLLLLDEPLSALDAGLPTRLAADVRAILTQEGITALMVTHDHEEAFTVADRLAVMRDGRDRPAGRRWTRCGAPLPTRRPPSSSATPGVLEGAAAAMVRDARAGGSPQSPTQTSRTVPPVRLAVRRSAFRVDVEGPLRGTVLAAGSRRSRCGWWSTWTASVSSTRSPRSTSTPVSASRCGCRWSATRTAPVGG